MKSAQNQQDLCNTSCLKMFSVFVLTVVKSGIKNCMLCLLVYDTVFTQFKADQSIYIYIYIYIFFFGGGGGGGAAL
jgi:hypothetical protein